MPWAWNCDDFIKNNPAIIKDDFSKFSKGTLKRK
jgi:hypothetical protein